MLGAVKMVGLYFHETQAAQSSRRAKKNLASDATEAMLN